MNTQSIRWRVTGLLVALAVHAGVYGLLVHPISHERGIHSCGLRYAALATVAYFPASGVAWLSLVYATTYASGEGDTTKAFTNTLLIAGAVWYGLIGYGLGRRMDTRSKGKRATEGQQDGAANRSQPVGAQTNRT
jgi:hypothetical protein